MISLRTIDGSYVTVANLAEADRVQARLAEAVRLEIPAMAAADYRTRLSAATRAQRLLEVAQENEDAIGELRMEDWVSRVSASAEAFADFYKSPDQLLSQGSTSPP